MIDKELISKQLEGIDSEKKDEIIDNLFETFKNTAQSEVNKAVGNTHQLYDDKMKELGFAKENGVHSTKHIESVIQKLNFSINEKAEKYAELKAKFEKGGNTGEPDKRLQEKEQELEAVRKSLEEKNKEYEAKLQDLSKQNKTNLARHILLSNLPKFKEGISENQKKIYTEVALNETINKIDFDENQNPIFKDEEGRTLLNPNNNQRPYTPAEILLNHNLIAEIADLGRKIGGNGTEKSAGATTAYKFTAAQNKEELIEQMRAAGIDHNTDEGLKIYTEESKRFAEEK